MGKRRKYTSEYKVKVVLELLREERTISEIAAAHEVNPNQLARWRQEFLNKAPSVFDEPKTARAQQRAAEEAEKERDHLLKTVGQLTMERDFLKAVQAKRDENRGLL